jgi:3-hydroxy-9,10-secoandrosta-1,3,5(10)-triene-9,17-dione monooxygenase reductase component
VRDPARVYRDTIGHFPTGVAVVTTTGPAGPAGMTTNAITSLSLDPLLMIVCFEKQSRTLEVVRTSRRFAVNVLRAGDHEIGIGEVVGTGAGEEGDPLVFYRGRYTTVAG